MGDRKQQAALRGLGRAGLLGLLGGLLAVGVTVAVGGAQTLDDYPDLVADPPESIQAPAEISWQGADILAVKFDGFVTNLGGGPLHIEGNPQPSAFGTAGAVAQRILDGAGSTLLELPLDTVGADPEIQFESSDDHDHWHLMRIMEYSLWDESKTAQVTAGAKIGFCLFDVQWIGSGASTPAVYAGGGNWCAAEGWPGGGPDATYLQMGVSSGWRDTYSAFINLQWIDVSEVAPGNYYLAAVADPNNIIEESDETNNSYAFAATRTVVPGYLAQNVGPVGVTGAQAISLPSTSFGSGLGAPSYVIASAPSHGTLDIAAGAPFSTASVTYTPSEGYDGEDSFTFYVYDSGSDYPRNPAAFSATVTLDVTTPNAAPTIGPIGDQTSVVGSDVSLQLVGLDPDAGDILTYAATGLPSGLEVNTATGLISGSPDSTGAHLVTVTVTDGTLSGQTQFSWAVVPAPTFADVPSSHRFAEAITWMAAQGISLGCGDGTNFCPDDPVSRGQVASFFARALGLTGGAGDDLFTDDDGSAHEDNIDAIATAGITVGCAAGRYCPGDDVTRGQFASLLVRATSMTGGETSDRFSDDNGSVHETNINVLAFNQVTSGCTTTTYCPLDSLSRGQLAQLLYRALGT